MTEMTSAEAALREALDQVELDVHATGWAPFEDAEWSLTVGRFSVYASAESAANIDGQLSVHLEASTGFLPWKRHELRRTIVVDVQRADEPADMDAAVRVAS